MKFEKNDWIIDIQSSEIHQHKENCRVLQEVQDKYQRLWKPQKGEICWFWYKHCSPILAKYISYDGEDYEVEVSNSSINNTKVVYTDYYTFCEPFIGKLPSYYQY